MTDPFKDFRAKMRAVKLRGDSKRSGAEILEQKGRIGTRRESEQVEHDLSELTSLFERTRSNFLRLQTLMGVLNNFPKFFRDESVVEAFTRAYLALQEKKVGATQIVAHMNQMKDWLADLDEDLKRKGQSLRGIFEQEKESLTIVTRQLKLERAELDDARDLLHTLDDTKHRKLIDERFSLYAEALHDFYAELNKNRKLILSILRVLVQLLVTVETYLRIITEIITDFNKGASYRTGTRIKMSLKSKELSYKKSIHFPINEWKLAHESANLAQGAEHAIQNLTGGRVGASGSVQVRTFSQVLDRFQKLEEALVTIGIFSQS